MAVGSRGAPSLQLTVPPSVAAGASVVGDPQLVVHVARASGYLEREQIAGGPSAASQSERPCDEGNARGPPHTKMSRAPAVSRRKRGVDITPASRSSTCASVRAIVSTDAEHA